MTSTEEEVLVSVSGLTKRFPGVTALSGVDFDLRKGEVHALVGENGAGKSTLVRILAGIETPDSGDVRVPKEGIRIVLQELNLIGTLSVAENVFLERMPSRAGVIDYPRMNGDARTLLAEVGLEDIDPARPVESLGVGKQQLVEIARGLSRRCEVLILDEPTASLTDSEVDLLFAQIAKLKNEGAGIIYISHRMEEIRRIADRVTVLRDGKLISTRAAAELTLEEIVRQMVGREVGEEFERPSAKQEEIALRVENLTCGRAVRNVSFEVRKGEILGFAGLMGSGRTETMRALFGADRPEEGRVFLRGSDRPARIRSPRDAVRSGIGMLTEDRKGQGLLLPLSVRVNTTLTKIRGLLRPAREREETGRLAKNLSIRCASLEQPVAQLSGGNQQKVVIAKWLFRNCDVLIFDEPTRGIDVGAKFEIFRLMADLAAQGKSLLVVSSELKELTAICDRIAVMSAGRLVEAFGRGDWTQDKIMRAALTGYLG